MPRRRGSSATKHGPEALDEEAAARRRAERRGYLCDAAPDRTRRIDELAPSWSPDGTTLTHTRGRPDQNAEIYSIWQVNPDGSCPEALLTGRPRGN